MKSMVVYSSKPRKMLYFSTTKVDNVNRLRRSSHQPSKGLSKYIPPESFDVDEPAIKGGGRPRRHLVHAKMLFVSISFLPLLGRLCFGRFYIFTEQMGF